MSTLQALLDAPISRDVDVNYPSLRRRHPVLPEHPEALIEALVGQLLPAAIEDRALGALLHLARSRRTWAIEILTRGLATSINHAHWRAWGDRDEALAIALVAFTEVITTTTPRQTRHLRAWVTSSTAYRVIAGGSAYTRVAVGDGTRRRLPRSARSHGSLCDVLEWGLPSVTPSGHVDSSWGALSASEEVIELLRWVRDTSLLSRETLEMVIQYHLNSPSTKTSARSAREDLARRYGVSPAALRQRVCRAVKTIAIAVLDEQVEVRSRVA